MLSYRTIPFLIAIALSIQSLVAVASDQNPWSMDVPGEGQHPYYDLNGSTTGGYVEPGHRGGKQTSASAPKSNGSGNESTIPKSLPSGERMGWQSAPGKGHRDQVYGYAGPQSGPRLLDRVPSASHGNGVRFGGKIFGAFPPLEADTVKRTRQPAQNIQGNVQGIQGSGSQAFANVPPPPIPDAAPAARLLPYPYVGYGIVPGYRAPYGMGIAPFAGSGRPGAGGLGPTLSNPGIPPGAYGPGFMW